MCFTNMVHHISDLHSLHIASLSSHSKTYLPCYGVNPICANPSNSYMHDIYHQLKQTVIPDWPVVHLEHRIQLKWHMIDSINLLTRQLEIVSEESKYMNNHSSYLSKHNSPHTPTPTPTTTLHTPTDKKF